MKTAMLKRLKRLEEVRAVESQPPVEFQIGYVKRLPHEYTGERHLVTDGWPRCGRQISVGGATWGATGQ